METIATGSQNESELIEAELKGLMPSKAMVFYCCQGHGDFPTTFISSNVWHLFGYHPEEFMTDANFRVKHLHPEDQARVISQLKRVFRENTHSIEYRLRRKDGTFRWIRDEFHILKNDLGRPQEFIGFWLDITERVQAEKRLRENKKALRTLTTSAQEAVFMMGDDGNISFWNSAAEKLFGRTAEEAIGQDARKFISSSRFFELPSKMPRKETFEIDGQRKDGSPFPMEISLSSIRVDDRWQTMSVVRDISERRHSEEKIIQVRDEFDTFFKLLPDLACILSIDGHLKRVGANWEKELGYSTDELLIRPFADFIHADDLAGTLSSIESELIGTPHKTLVNRILCKNGEIKWFDWKLTVAKDRKLLFAVGRDITQQKLLKDTLQQYAGAVVEAQEVERRRISQELHDGVIQLLGVTLHRLRGEPTDHASAQIPQELLVKAIDEVRRISHSLRSNILDDLGLSAALRSLCHDFELRTKKAVKVQLEDLTIPMDNKVDLAIYRITQEALTNIEKHSDAALIEVRLWTDSSSLHLEIEDNGRGFQLSKGQGLGLLHMRERALSVGGATLIKSIPRKGTKILVTIPFRSEGA
ncbi:MAG: hypothetical protein A2X86_00755 [Bdellovibrionales bacterium GWA2_49_15]|nr:MAG: hypothetical protein A2X86_00755 [Bdellovibrionales bacterium GWA2_49_15]HAZ14609.1 hypothetical protein [Bdellovibrionales bacterium]